MRGLGVKVAKNKVIIYGTNFVAESEDGIEFKKSQEVLDFDPENILNIKFSRLDNLDLISYEKKATRSTQAFFGEKKLPSKFGPGVVVPDYNYKKNNIAYFGGENITVGIFKTTKRFKFVKTAIQGERIDVDFAIRTSQGIFVIYHTYIYIDNIPHLIIKGVFFDPTDPTQIIWETRNALWSEPDYWKGKKASCLGFVYFNGKLISYWDIEKLGMFLIQFPVLNDHPAHEGYHYKLNKHPANPIISPNVENIWENEAAFNPAAFTEDGKVYLLYRALGHGYLSVLGYAESADGINFHRPFDEPIYTARESFETKSRHATDHSIKKFMSAGGIAGCEDPRVTKIGDRLYMIYVAFNGWQEPRLAITSILYENFLKKHFLWEKPVLISAPNVIDKSGCLLPEKISGKYVIFHRVYPNILIDFVDNLDFDGTNYLKGEYKISPRPTMWDSRKIGAGAPPIKTDDGWLLIYQAVTDNDDSKYKVGAMLLDLKDPTKVLYRSSHPIIEPTEHYENGLAKFGIVYPCGAVIVNDTLMVYYGGSDTVTCVATTNLKEFLQELKSGNVIKLTLSI
jgi:beta-1,2-mannobiose phosphorylase / 1,2-beta-oligomannan phosphorylase